MPGENKTCGPKVAQAQNNEEDTEWLGYYTALP